MIAVRRKILADLLADSEWRQRFDQAKSTAEVESVIFDYCRAKGIKIVEIRT